MILLVQTTPDRGYGAEAVLGHLLRGLPESERAGVLLVSPAASPLVELWTGLGGKTVPLAMTRDTIRQSLPAAWRLASQLRAEGVRPSLVFSWSLRATDAALLLGKRLGAPVAGLLHDHPAAAHEGEFRRRLFRWETGRLKALVAVSGAVRDEMETVFGPSPKWRIIRNGLVDLPSGERRAQKTPPAGVVRLGFIGMHNSWKGWPVVVEAVAELENLLPPDAPVLEWHLFGDPRPEFAAQAGNLGSKIRRQRLVLRGHQSTEVIFSEIDLLVHASTRFDPYPTVLLEAARAGLPAIASNLGGGPEIVREDVTGWIVSPEGKKLAQAIVRHGLSPDALTTAGQAARSRFEAEFGVGRMVKDYLALWRELGG